MPVINVGTRTPYAYEQISVSTPAVGLTLTTWNTLLPDGVSSPKEYAAFLSVETQQFRYTLDGKTTPTAAVGHLMNPGDTLVLENATAMKNFKAFAVTGTALLNATYFRR